MLTELRQQPFSAWQELAQYQQQQTQMGKFGANAVFVGSMRNHHQGDQVIAMQLDYYPAMTEKTLQQLVTQAVGQWPLLDILILHRVGKIEIGEHIVLIATWSAHRRASFESCRFLIEALKSTVPFWKKEYLADGSKRWVKENTKA